MTMNGFLIHSALEHYAQTNPGHPALSFQGSQLSYAILDLRANQLANALIKQGAQKQDRVGIFMHKCLELGVAIYGCLKAGCVFVPLDPFMPADRLALILQDCDIQHIVSSDILVEPLANAIDQCRTSDAICAYGTTKLNSAQQLSWEDISACSEQSPQVIMIDQELGYIMYTSGSTGTPKGMMHTHLGSITYARWGREHVGLSATDRVASHAPLHFDLSIFDFFSTAQAGATVCLVPEMVTRFPANWTKTIEDERISVVFTVPFTLTSMYEQGAMERRDLSSLRWILFGGEPYPPNKLRNLMLALPQVKFSNVYGPAEAPSCTVYDVVIPAEGDDEPLPIGIVSRNSTDIVVDEQDQDCPDGSPGELCIRSSTLTRGYWNRPDLNAKAFLTRQGFGPFPDVYYRTGDRVVRHQDGMLRFLGRIDRMIKTRGHRVELDEIEAVFASLDCVLEAAAFAVPDEFDSNTILASVKLEPESSFDSNQLTQHARSKLPIYAVPREILICDALPHTSSGKINRQKLAENWLLNNRPNNTE